MPTYLSPGVYVEEAPSGSRPIQGVGTAVAAFVGFAPTGPLNTPVLIPNWSSYVAQFGEFAEGSYLAHAVYGYLNNGGSICYVVRVGSGPDDRDDADEPSRPAGALPAAEPATLGPFRLTPLPRGNGSGPLTAEVTDSQGENVPEDRFTLLIKEGDNTLETFDVSARKGARNYIVNQVRQNSKLVSVEEATPSGQVSRPANQTVTLNPPPAAVSTRGSDAPRRLNSGDFMGDTDDRTGLGGLEEIDEITMVAVPDAMAAYERGALDMDGLKAVQLALISHCEQMGDRMAILDPPPAMKAKDILDWRQQTAAYDSAHSALYYPWIRVFDPASGQPRLVPPSGHMAGVWARTDAARGVHKAPANEVVRGAIDLGTQITRGEQGMLNPVGINCIRTFPGRGVRVWGARTLSSDPAWRYLNVRRYFNYLEESILDGTQWVVFEPNDRSLWNRIRRNVTAFLLQEWRSGALFGNQPQNAFYVKCDAETNPPESVDQGRVVCEIGVAPVKPAEFVIFRLSQYSEGGAELTE
ncbi:phage tail sheath family protein [Pseudonocardia xinjiangensis]|uniref:phage tail sheath family protein n=1 Tax=Pseudonocardia xinjiangensis TaxID=75289 RepID=UPI003D8D4575